MSRCFPYPPPGYTLSSARNEALIESIKLQKEKERKKEKKEKRKEKKEKKRKEKKEKKERKEKSKDKSNPNLEHNIPDSHVTNEPENPKHHISDNSDILKHRIGDKSDIPRHQNGPADTKLEVLHKKREAEIEQSSLTEEHACPVSLSVPSSSFESTEKSKKRRRNSLPTDDTHVHGKVILIRLPSKKQDEIVALPKAQPSDMLDGSRDGPTKLLNGTGNTTVPNTEHICSTSRQIEAGTNGKPTITKKAVLTPMQKMELEYKNLLEGCFPPLVQDGCVDPNNDLDWLLVGRRNQEVGEEKKLRFGSERLSCSRSSGLWPRAEYLPEVDVYALPYTVPY